MWRNVPIGQSALLHLFHDIAFIKPTLTATTPVELLLQTISCNYFRKQTLSLRSTEKNCLLASHLKWEPPLRRSPTLEKIQPFPVFVNAREFEEQALCFGFFFVSSSTWQNSKCKRRQEIKPWSRETTCCFFLLLEMKCRDGGEAFLFKAALRGDVSFKLLSKQNSGLKILFVWLWWAKSKQLWKIYLFWIGLPLPFPPRPPPLFSSFQGRKKQSIIWKNQ